MHIVTIKPVKKTVDIHVRQGEDVMEVKFTHQKILQLDILSGVACTGHRLQGQTKEALICVDWTYAIDNWMYVVLSRVTTINGLFLMQSIDKNRICPPKESLL